MDSPPRGRDVTGVRCDVTGVRRDVRAYLEEREESSSGDQAQALLERLQRQARERQLKKQQEAATPEPSRQPQAPDLKAEPPNKPQAPHVKADVQVEPKRKTKKRKREEEESPPGDPASEKAEASGEENHTPRKKRKKKRKGKVENGQITAGLLGSGGRTEKEGSPEKTEEKQTTGSPRETLPGPADALILGGFGKKALQKVQPFLPQWLAEPSRVGKSVTEDLVPIRDIPGIHPGIQKKLEANGISSYFPVQAAVIPAVLEGATHGFLVGRGGYRPRDICVSAPTGSGKTLSFVIPVVQILSERAVCHVRALVVLPTKELAQQVSKVFHTYTEQTVLRVALVTGQKSLAKEQELLVQETDTGYRSLADIVVATPGRLVDHIDQTPGFSLRQLRFLVIDEADRMIDSMQQSWLPRVMAAVFGGGGSGGPRELLQRTAPGVITAASSCRPQMPLQKLLFSATLTRDPEKLQQLGLYQPHLFSATGTGEGPAGDGKYTFPAGLSHYYVPCGLSSKPLLILHLLRQGDFPRVLCFTNSRENSHRLFLLIQAFGGVKVAEFSSRCGPGQRKLILKQFEQGKIQLLISTDATARGIDVEGVKLVINYDAPHYIRSYVHRVGRTARAGRTGLAYTFLLQVQEQKFLRMLQEAGAPTLQPHPVRRELLEPLVPQYQAALATLQKTIKEERKQRRA
ncbi:ATP-dependent RNA helicase DDX51 [Tachyglossus aculeatus]|uniref:ATP-dependent RNA helicase DDX51 n=1 Tax=Tachyglossus aculeatus TaxID=9261 RepID=UPI0018F33706|nr:ATP-dependent RNA helicase DDX51 [Tachyglossus aculeatus]